mgnify:CR=1 FL=1
MGCEVRRGYNKTISGKGSKGFTLVEVLVVVALIATMLAIGVPSIISQMSHLRLTRSVREVSVELSAARLKAIAFNRRVRVAFNVYGGTPLDDYRINLYDSGTSTWSADPTRPLIRLKSAIRITSPGGSFNVDFFANGTASPTSVCITNTAKAGDQMKVTVQGSTGMVTITTGC